MYRQRRNPFSHPVTSFTKWLIVGAIVATTGAASAAEITIPHTENFDSLNDHECLLPANWAQGPDGSSACPAGTSGFGDWVSETAGTASGGTGPSGDHTGGGTYLFAEASGTPNPTMLLDSPSFELCGPDAPELRFWVHKSGAGNHELRVNVVDATDSTIVLSDDILVIDASHNSTAWTQFSVPLPTYTSSTEVRVQFEWIYSSGFVPDIAIDDVEIVETGTAGSCGGPTACYSPPVAGSVIMSQCFDTVPVPGSPADLSSINWIQVTSENSNGSSIGDWYSESNGTGSSGTGPTDDHTSPTDNSVGTYLFVEASNQNADTVEILSEDINLTGSCLPVLNFAYHRQESGTTPVDHELHVDIVDASSTAGAITVIASDIDIVDSSDPQSTSGVDWKEVSGIDLSSYIASGTVKARFRWVRNPTFASTTASQWQIDLAMDDVSVVETDATCGAPPTGPTAPVCHTPPVSGDVLYEQCFDDVSTPAAPADTSGIGWIQVTNENTNGTPNATVDWWADNDTTPSNFNTGPTDDHTTPGDTTTGTYLYVESNSNDADTVEILSPPINLTGSCTPKLNYYYHRRNDSGHSSLNELHVDLVTAGSSANSVTVIANDIDVRDTIYSPDWMERAGIDLSPYISNGSVRLRYRWVRDRPYDPAATFDPDRLDIAIDDVSVVDDNYGGCATSGTPPGMCATTPEPIQNYYLPFPEHQVIDALDTIFPGSAACGDTGTTVVGTEANSYNSISMAQGGGIIYYDHWEDGYELEPTSLNQPTTEVWGDNDPSNGMAPGYTTDVFNAADVIVLSEPAIDTTVLGSFNIFDGRDKFSSTVPLAVTRVSWATGEGGSINTLLAGALEVYNSERWGQEFVIPVGEDMPGYSGGSDTNGWTVTAGSQWEAGTPTYVAGPNGCGQGLGCWGTDHDAGYAAGIEILQTPVFNVPAASDGNITVSWLEVEDVSPFPSGSSFNVDYSCNGGAQNTLYSGTNVNQTTWTLTSYNLTCPAGSTLQLFFSANFVIGGGDWGVGLDDFKATDNTGDFYTADFEGAPPPTNTDFDMYQYTGAAVMASEDNTVVDVDLDGDGITDQTIALNEGESTLIDGGFFVGGTITASAPVQTNMITGEICATYESRWHTLYPKDQFASSYYAPTGSSLVDSTTIDTAVYLHNPNNTPITVDWQTANGAQPSVALAPHETQYVMMDVDSGAQFSTGDNSVFTAIGAISVALGSRDTSTHDWGYALVPENSMSQNILVGLGLGQDPTQAITENSAPVWVTAAMADGSSPTGTIEVCVDANADGFGPFVYNGQRYDQHLSLNLLEAAKVYDQSDGDQTAMVLFVCDPDANDSDNAVITATWGQDPTTASVGQPAIDVGTTIPNMQGIILSKSADLLTDHNGDGQINAGDVLRYGINVCNAGLGAIAPNQITIDDVLPNEVIYNANTTEYIDPSNAPLAPIADAGSTAFPLDEGGSLVPDLMNPGETVEYFYETTITSLPAAPDTIENFATATHLGEPITDATRTSRTVAIGDTVWLDTDGDMIHDFGEPGLSGVTLQLYECDANSINCVPYDSDPLNGGIQPLTAITDANGEYLFEGLPPDYYTVRVMSGVPGGVTLSTVDDPGLSGDNSVPVPLTTGEAWLDADFGYAPLAAVIGDTVWWDADASGTQNAGEAGAAGVSVQLWDAGADNAPGGGDDTLISSQTTDAGGNYLFTNVAPNTVFVQISPPAGSTVTNGLQSPGANNHPAITIASGETNLLQDFGLNSPDLYSITDTLWHDIDFDGLFDPLESPISGVTVELLDGSGNIVATTTSDVNGDFVFSGVTPGNYTINVTDSTGNLNGLVGTTTPGINRTMGVTVVASDVVGENFGYSGLGTIGDTIYADFDASGAQESGEPGLTNITVDLYDLGPDTLPGTADDVLVATTTTDGSGHYQFDGLTSGTYGIEVSDYNGELVGFTNTADPDGGFDHRSTIVLADIDHDSDPGTPTVVESNLEQDFGYHTGSGTYIGGTVYYDNDLDAVDTSPSGDFRLDGVTVNLVEPGPDGIFGTADDSIAATTTTDVNGEFAFNGAQLDTPYYVDVVDATVPGYAPVHTTDNDPSSVACPSCHEIILTAANSSVTSGDSGGTSGENRVDFGYGGITTTPITLRSFKAKHVDGNLVIKWSTATEVGNLGFNLYVHNGDAWRRLNEQLIPSHKIDSLEVLEYRARFESVTGKRFAIEDVSVEGVTRLRGPFKLDRKYGTSRSGQAKFNTELSSKERKRKRALREARRAARMAELAEQIRASDTGSQQIMAASSDAGAANEGIRVARFTVKEKNVYRVTHGQLLASGINLTGTLTERLSVVSGGKAVAARIVGRKKADGTRAKRIGNGSWIEFLGEPVDTLYSGSAVYWLVVDGPAHVTPRFDVRTLPDGAPEKVYRATATIDAENEYSFASPTADPWFAERLLAMGQPAEGQQHEVELKDMAAGPVSVKASYWGGTDFPGTVDHHVTIELNGVSIHDDTFDGIRSREVDVVVPDGIAVPGVNTLQLKLPSDHGARYDVVNLDSISVEYPRKLKAIDDQIVFTSSAHKLRVKGFSSSNIKVWAERSDGKIKRKKAFAKQRPDGTWQATFRGEPVETTYFVATKSKKHKLEVDVARDHHYIKSGDAQYLVISHPDFINDDALEQLVSERSARYSVKVVDVRDVYDAYSDGVVDAQAIAEYIAYAATNLGTEMVLLVGGDDYNYRDFGGTTGHGFIPSLYRPTDNVVRFAPVDPAYGDIDGDNIPEIAIGRLPVRTSDELATIVTQTLLYDQKTYPATAVFAADSTDSGTRYSFSEDSDALIESLPNNWQVTTAYIDALGVAGAKSALVNAINSGAALTSYFGHSSFGQWSFDDLFNTDDVTALTNGSMPTVVTQWGCWNTYYVAPGSDTIGHRLLLSGERGAAAVMGASTLTYADHESALAQLLYAQLVQPGKTIGEAMIQAKRAFASSRSGGLDVLIGWTLLGDPALIIENQ